MDDKDAVSEEVVATGAKARRKFFTTVALAGSNELRSYLPLDEMHYLRLALEAQPDARAYLMYSVLDSVYQVGVAMMRWEDLLPDEEDTTSTSSSCEERLIQESFSAEGAMWTRRLIEVLTNLVCFSQTNEEPYYRHWLLIDQLDSFGFTRKDQREYFACDSKGLSRWIDQTIARVRAVEPSVDLNRCWYLDKKAPLGAAPKPGLLTSFGSNLRRAIPLAKPRERAELGFSYKQFSDVSGSIHFTPGDKWYARGGNDLAASFTRCALLVQSILLRVIDLCGMTPKKLCAQLVEVYDANTVADEGSQQLTNGRAVVGDFVVVGRSLARVAEVKPSSYGYESYVVRYLEDPPAADVTDDNVLPYQVRRLHETERIKRAALELMKKMSTKSISDEERMITIEESVEETVRELWKTELRAHLFGRKRGA